jgi:hypothetical protein
MREHELTLQGFYSKFRQPGSEDLAGPQRRVTAEAGEAALLEPGD